MYLQLNVSPKKEIHEKSGDTHAAVIVGTERAFVETCLLLFITRR